MAVLPVRLDPFQNIVNVGWPRGFDFLMITMVNTGSSEFDPGSGLIDGANIHVLSPSGHSNTIYAGYKPVDGDHQWYPFPLGDIVIEDVMIARAVGFSWLNGPSVEYIFGAEMYIFFINIKLLWDTYREQLLEEGEEVEGEEVPASFRFGIHYGDDEEDPPDDNTPVMRIDWFRVAELDDMQEVVNMATLVQERFVERGLGDNESGDITILDLLETSMFPAEPMYTSTFAIPDTRNPVDLTLEWNYAQRSNTEDYPPDGARPGLI